MSDNTMTTETIEEKFQSYLKQIVPADRHAMELAKKRWDSVAKPIGSLGILEVIQHLAGEERASGAHGVTQSHSASVGIDLVIGDAAGSGADAGQSLGGKGLVEFDEVHILQL